MAYFSKNGSGIDSNAYIYVQLQVTRTDYPTYSRFSVKSVAVSDTGSSSFIRGQVTTNQAGDSWTAATGWKNVSYNGTTMLATATFDVTRGASNKTAHIGAYAQGGGTGIYAGGTDYAWLNVTVPKVLAPNAPTGCAATYVSDSQASVSWTNGTTDSDHPRDATLVERRDGSNDWAQVASASGTASGYTDNGISANTQYQYRVRAKNVAGYSAYSTSGSIYTTPAAPASVTLDKTAATTVQVDVTGTWGYAVTYDIESTYDGGSTWASVATSTSLPYSATVNAGTVQFRVRAVRGALSSAWTNSASLVTICPPLAPTIVQAPANPTAFGDSSAISWTPNHPDGSAQESAEVKVTNPSGTSTTYSVSTATSYSFTPNATGTWTVQVRTKGLDPSYGEWSQSVSWAVANPPAVVITSPATDGTDIVALPLNVAWTVTDPTGVSTQRIIIEGDGQILNRTLAGDVRTVALNASDVALENGQTYTIRLRVMGGSGLVTEQTRIFDVAWLAPTPPVLQITEGEGKSATIDVMDTRYTSSGTVLEASSSMMESLTIHGKSVQDGTPSPSAPVEIKSVQSTNLFNPAFHGTSVYNGAVGTAIPAASIPGTLTYSFDENGVEMKSTAAWGGATIISEPLTVGSTYVMSLSVVSAANTPRVTTYTLDSDYVIVRRLGNYANNSDSACVIPAITIASGEKYIAVSVSSTTANDPVTIYRPQINHGALGYYSPYGMVQVSSVGANIATLEANYGITESDGVFTATAIWFHRWYAVNSFLAKADGTFPSTVTVSFEAYTDGNATTSGNGIMVFGKNAGGTIVQYFASVPNSTTSWTRFEGTTGRSDIASIGISYSSGGANIWHIRNLCIRLDGSTEYVPYDGTTTPIDLQGNTVCSLSDGIEDKLVIDSEGNKTLTKRVGEVTFDGTEDGWSLYTPSGHVPYARINITPTCSSTLTYDSYLSNLAPAANVGNSNDNEGFTITTASQLRIRIASYTTIDEYKALFTATPLTVTYPLATPQTISLGTIDLPYVDGSAWVDAEVTPQIEATFRPVDFPDQPAADSVDVVRVNADGSTWTVASGLSVGDTAIDPLPPLGVPVEYRAVGTAPSGATSSGSYTETIGGREWVLNFGNAAQESILFRYNPEASYSLTQGGTSYHFADGGAGGGRPVYYATTDRDESGSLKFATIGKDDADRLRALCDRYPVAWLRDPFGHRWRAHVKPSWSHGVGQLWPVGIDWDAVRWTEAWDG